MNVTVLRSNGLLGSVWVTYQTSGGGAVSGVDFAPASGRLMFRPGQASGHVTLGVYDDSLPEAPEEFYFSITAVELLNDR